MLEKGAEPAGWYQSPVSQKTFPKSKDRRKKKQVGQPPMAVEACARLSVGGAGHAQGHLFTTRRAERTPRAAFAEAIPCCAHGSLSRTVRGRRMMSASILSHLVRACGVALYKTFCRRLLLLLSEVSPSACNIYIAPPLHQSSSLSPQLPPSPLPRFTKLFTTKSPFNRPLYFIC